MMHQNGTILIFKMNITLEGGFYVVTTLHRKRRTIISYLTVAALCFVVMIAFSACDFYAGKRPPDYDQSTWICDEYRIAITVSSELEPAYTRVYIADLNRKDISASFDYGTEMLFFEASSKEYDPLLIFDCDFSSKEMDAVVKKDNLFGGSLFDVNMSFRRTDYISVDDLQLSIFRSSEDISN